MSVNLDNRVSTLEQALERYIENSNKILASFSSEMKDFKDEMGEFKDEMREDRREMNRQWGNLANKMGTIVEDIIFPGIRPALKKYFNSQLEFLGIHIHKKIKETGVEGEFDVIAIDADRVFLVEVKSSPDKEKIDTFIKKVIPKFRQLYPEQSHKKLIPIMGSLRFSEDLIAYASKSGVYLMGYREWDYLDILNFDQVKAR